MAYNIFRVDEEVKMKRKRSDMDDNNNDNNVTDNVTNFRTVNACNRCRQRKNRCDQKLPACSGCEKYGVACVGYDPLLRRQIPRSYVLYLEDRVKKLESLLKNHSISYPSPNNLEAASIPFESTPIDSANTSVVGEETKISQMKQQQQLDRRQSTSAIAFATLVQDAVRKYINPNGNKVSGGGTFFGLYSPTNGDINAPFPDISIAKELTKLYFDYANPQMPTLHRGEFEKFLEETYKTKSELRSSRSIFMINIVCAIGAGTIMNTHKDESRYAEPEHYYISAKSCLDKFFTSAKAIDSTPTGLEELQAVLLVANFALLRPVSPGLWYIAGIAMRLAKNYGLYHEPRLSFDNHNNNGKFDWSQDIRRRLWWCTYSIDRLASVCVGRPASIDEAVITTPLPSALDDKFITPKGFIKPEHNSPSYKAISYHYFRLRYLQAEIMQVLEYRRSHLMRNTVRNLMQNENFTHELKSPFLDKFNGDFRKWRLDMEDRLHKWQTEIPLQKDTGVNFDPLYLELNFWQALVMLYRHSLEIPKQLASEFDENTLEETSRIENADREEREDEEVVFCKAGVAAQKVIMVYRQLDLKKLVNYTFLATHHIFICGVTFLFAIWKSSSVRESLSPEDIDLTVLAAETVLTTLIQQCSPAQNARDAFKRMSKLTMAFYLANRYNNNNNNNNFDKAVNIEQLFKSRYLNIDNGIPKFDTGFKRLFSEEDLAGSNLKERAEKYIKKKTKSSTKVNNNSNNQYHHEQSTYPLNIQIPSHSTNNNDNSNNNNNNGIIYDQNYSSSQQITTPHQQQMFMNSWNNGHYNHNQPYNMFNNPFGATAGVGFELGFGVGTIFDGNPDGGGVYQTSTNFNSNNHNNSNDYGSTNYQMLNEWLVGGQTHSSIL